MDNEKLLRMIDAAMKGGITELTDFGASILRPEKLTKLIRKVQLATKILPQARYTNMTAHIHDIDRVSFTGRILKSGTDGASVHRSLSTSDYAKPTFAINQLIAKEFIAIASLRDSALRRNIERENFEDTLIDLIGEAVGRDLEEFALFANSDDISYNNDDVLSKTKGWIASAANAVYGDGTSKDFDPSGDTYPENMFDEMLEATPKEYLNNPEQWRFWVDWNTRDDYLNLLKKRETNLGDAIYRGELPPYKGIPVEYVPLLARATTDNNGCGRVAILGFPNNFAWGVFHQVGIEREREAKERRTDFVLTLEADAKFEDENATTIAYIEGTNPES
jgi:hypothetical protein